jgi:hypothetical protein
MSDFVEDFESRYETPTDEEVRREMTDAYKRGDRTLSEALVNFWSMLRRNIGGKAAASKAHHA